MKVYDALLMVSLVVSWSAVALSCSASDANANTVACYNVADADARAYCLARVKREPAQCYNIQRADLRSQCLAEVRR